MYPYTVGYRYPYKFVICISHTFCMKCTGFDEDCDSFLRCTDFRPPRYKILSIFSFGTVSFVGATSSFGTGEILKIDEIFMKCAFYRYTSPPGSALDSKSNSHSSFRRMDGRTDEPKNLPSCSWKEALSVTHQQCIFYSFWARSHFLFIYLWRRPTRSEKNT